MTFESSVGPNTVDIMKYLIDTYTTLSYDNDSFNYCAEKLADFSSNFALVETKNIIDVLRDIAFQCRCAIWISDDVFYMKYLPEEPTLPDFTLPGVWRPTPTTWVNDPNWMAVPPAYVDTTGLVTHRSIPRRDRDHRHPPGTGLGDQHAAEPGRGRDSGQRHRLGKGRGSRLHQHRETCAPSCTKMKVTWRMDLAPDNPYRQWPYQRTDDVRGTAERSRSGPT